MSLLDSVFVHGIRALWTRFSNAEMDRCGRSKCDEQRRRKKQAKPSNPRANFDQTQAAKALGDGNWIRCVVSRCRSSGIKKQRCKNLATQAPITKPRRFLADYQTQVMEIGSDTRFLATAPVEEKNTLVFGAWKWRVGRHLERKERKNKKKNPCFG